MCRVYYVPDTVLVSGTPVENGSYPSGDRLVLERNNVEVINQIYRFLVLVF